MRQAANRRSRSALNRPSRTSVSSSRDVEATSRNGRPTVRCRAVTWASPSRSSRASRRWADAGSSSMLSRNNVPDPASRMAEPRPRASRSGAFVRLEAAPNSRSSMSAGSAARLSMATIGTRRAAAALKALEQLLRAQSGLRQQTAPACAGRRRARAPPGHGAPRPTRRPVAAGPRPARRTSRATGGPPFSELEDARIKSTGDSFAP